MAKKSTKPNKILFRIGIWMIIIGVFVLLSAVFGKINQTAFSVGPQGVSASDVPPMSAVPIIVGIILIVLGGGIIGLAYKVGK